MVLYGKYHSRLATNLKFGPAVSQKELEKALHEPIFHADREIVEPGEQLVVKGVTARLATMKCRIEFTGQFEDVKRISDEIKKLTKQPVES